VLKISAAIATIKTMKPDNDNAFFVQIEGRVQGVGFRYSAVCEAERLGIKGWVRNVAGGKVEIWAEGPHEKLERYSEWLYRGPQLSRVDAVKKQTTEPQGYINFRVEY
jgi:acylphosphatase